MECKYLGCNRKALDSDGECGECQTLRRYDVVFKTVLKSSSPSQSARYNSGKVNPIELNPEFIMGMAEVLTKSRVKYPEFNWALPTKLSTPYQSLFRHLMAFQSGEDIDPEDGCHHMLKVAINAMFIHFHNTNFKEESDDRFFKKDKK